MTTTRLPARTTTHESLRAQRALIQRIYRNYPWPLLVFLSTGKDSSASCQLVCEAIEQLPFAERRNPIHVVIGDVGGSETPQVRERIQLTARLLSQYAEGSRMPLSAHIVTPCIADRLLVCLVGRGYAAPTSGFRWCTERAKIQPGRQLVRSLLGRRGQAIQILGVRVDESSARARSIARHTISDDSPLRRTSITGLWGLHPIETWTTADVWWYLSTFPSPWGGWHYNQTLAQLYKSASTEKECPVVLDKSGPSCGASRFGCWHCTVPSFNHSLAVLIEDEQHAWAWPLMEIWEFLHLSVQPEHKHTYREPRRRSDGSIHLKRDGSQPIPGKYKLSVRLLLEMILRAQRDMRSEGPDPQLTLLDEDEIRAIRVFWREHPDYPKDGSDPAREISACLSGIDIGPWQPGDVALLERPPAPRRPHVAAQQILDLFGIEQGATQ